MRLSAGLFAMTILVPCVAGATPAAVAPYQQSLRPQLSQHKRPEPCYRALEADSEAPDRKLAIVLGEPGSCTLRRAIPAAFAAGASARRYASPCAKGFRCTKSGSCVPTGELKGRPNRYSFIGLTGGIRIGASDPAFTQADLRAEIGGRYLSFQLGFDAGDGAFAIRGAVIGHYYFQPWSTLPLFVAPRFGIGYAFNFVDAPSSPRVQDFLITVSARLRYDFHHQWAILFDPLEIDIGYLRLLSADGIDLKRDSNIPVNIGIRAGIAFLYGF